MLFTIKFVFFLILISVVVKFGSLTLEKRLLYHPDSVRVSPLEVGLRNVSEKEINSADGTKILTWWAKAEPNKYTLLYFHGNGGSLSSRSDRFQDFMAKGYGIVMMTYRGYSGSQGTPSERVNISDAKIVFKALREEGIPEKQIVLYGESLGTGVALQIAAENKVAGLILDAPYTSMVDLAGLHYPLLPARWLMRDRYESLKHAGKISAPLLVVHGESDIIVPVEMGKTIATAVKGPSEIATFPGAGHTDHYQFGSFDKITQWLKELSRN